MTNPTSQQQNDFLTKVLPLAEKAIAAEGFTTKQGNPVPRAINLAMGLQPRTKAERQLQEVLLSMIARAHPGDEYPEMCAPAPAIPTLH